MNIIRNFVIVAACICCINSASAADPLTDFLNRTFNQNQTVQVQTVKPEQKEAPQPQQSESFFSRLVNGIRAKTSQLTHTAPTHTVLASYYGGGEKLNKHTSNGEVFKPNGLTAAHRTLPLGTKLLVTRGQHSVIVRVNDRGPAAWTGRHLDLSKGAARHLGMLGIGVAPVKFSIIN